MSRISAFLMAGAVAGALASASSAQALETVYSDFGPKNAFNASFGDLVANPGSGFSGTEQVASYFYAPVGGTLDHIDIAIGSYFGGPDAGVSGVSVALVTNNDGTGYPSNAQSLEEWIVTKAPSVYSKIKPTKLASKVHPALSAGTYYWVVVTPIGYDVASFILDNSTGACCQSYSNDGGNTWNLYSGSVAGASFAFDVWVK